MNTNRQKLEGLVNFAAQAYTGTQISLFKDCGLPYDCVGPKSMRVKEVSLGKYLDTCWKSLILDDDPFVSKNFNSIHQQLPQESPICLMQLIYNTGLHIFSNPPTIASSSSKSKRNQKNQDYVETLREMLFNIYKEECFDHFSKILDENHKCIQSEPSFDTITKSDPNIRLFTYPEDFLDFLIIKN